MDMQSVLSRLIAKMPTLSRQLRQAAKYILDAPEEVAIRSMRGLAGEAGVAPATMMRLAQALDFPNFETFRAPFEQALRGSGDRIADGAVWLQSLETKGKSGQIAGDIAAATMANVEASFKATPPETIEKAADLICGARNVYVIGIGALHHIAGYFQFVANMASPNVWLADPPGGAMFDDLRRVGKGDVALVLSFRPYATASVESARLCHEHGADIIALTDSRTSPIAANASALLISPTDSPQFFPSLAAATALLEAVIALTVSKAETASVERIKEIQEFRHNTGLYWTDGEG